ncbi:MAG: Lar family restriction alleviation protein [Caulobacteraceae bacterium]
MSDHNNPPPGGGLKACPFCGCAALEVVFGISGTVECSNRSCQATIKRHARPHRALAAWNRRAEGAGPVALDSAEAERRRQEPAYKLIQRIDLFLHDAMEVPSLKDRAAELHAEIHEAAFEYVTGDWTHLREEAFKPGACNDGYFFMRQVKTADLRALLAAHSAQSERIAALEARIARAVEILTPMSRQFYSGWYDSDAPKHHVAIKAETEAKQALAALTQDQEPGR